MNNKGLKIIYSTAIGAIAVVIFITFITINAELYLPIKDWLKNTFSHHWIGKGILSLAIFMIVGLLVWFLPVQQDEERTRKILMLLNWLLILGSLAIFGFFLWEVLR